MFLFLPNNRLSSSMKNLIIGIILLLPIFANGQDTSSVNLSNPYQTVYTHLSNLQDDSYYPEIAQKALNAKGVDASRRAELAVKLKQIFDGKGYMIDLDKLPRNPNFKDTITGKAMLVVDDRIPLVYLEKVGNKWFFSSKTVENIDELHADVYPWGTDSLVQLLSNGHSLTKYFGLYSWQILGILIIVFFSFLIHMLLTWVFEGIIIRLLIRAGQRTIAGQYIKPVAKPFSLFAVAFLLTILIPVLQLPIIFSKYIIVTIKALIPIFGTMVFYKMVDLLAAHFEKLAAKNESTLDDQLVPLIRRALKVFVVITGGLFTLQNLNFNITALLAGISIGGLAFALAAQDTLKNLFGSLMIFVDRPFQIGDWIISDKIDGSVEEVGFRSTRVRTFHNSVTYVPNGKMADMTIDNMGMRQYRRYKTSLAITYDTPADLIEVFVKGLERIVLEHPATRKDFYNIYLNNFGASSLEILFYIFFEVPALPAELKARHEIMISIIKLAEELGVRFAFPTQTLHMENFPEKKSLTPEYSGNKDEYETKMSGWFEKEKVGAAREN